MAKRRGKDTVQCHNFERLLVKTDEDKPPSPDHHITIFSVSMEQATPQSPLQKEAEIISKGEIIVSAMDELNAVVPSEPTTNKIFSSSMPRYDTLREKKTEASPREYLFIKIFEPGKFSL